MAVGIIELEPVVTRNTLISRLLAFVFSLGILSACAEIAKPPPQLKDEGLQSAAYFCADAPWCNFTAAERPWPEVTPKSSFMPFDNWIFLVQLPPAPEKLSVSWTSQMLVARYANYKIVVTLGESPDFRSIADGDITLPSKDKGRYALLDYFEIMFTAKPGQPEPENSYDRGLWRTAFFMKSSVQYKSATEAEIYRNGPWTVYTVKLAGESNPRQTVITHKNSPSRYVQISDYDAPKTVITDLIATIQLASP